MKFSVAKVIASVALVVCLALPARAGDEQLEDKYAAKYGHGKFVEWEMAKTFTKDQRDALCSSAHELTGHGPAKMKESTIIDAYLRFSSKYKPVFTKVLSCKQDNKKGHTYFVTQGVDQNALTLVQTDPSLKKIRGRDVFRFFWTVGQVRGVPTLLKMNAPISKL